jgi:hypothetical protein
MRITSAFLMLSAVSLVHTNSYASENIIETENPSNYALSSASSISKKSNAALGTLSNPHVIDSEDETPDVFTPLIISHSTGVTLSSSFEDVQKTLLKMNVLSYAMIRCIKESTDLKRIIAKSRRDALIDQFMDKGWTITPLDGKVGRDLEFDDIPGFVAYNAQSNLVTIIFHGTASEDDWGTNMNFKKVKAKNLGLVALGKVHNGFGAKYASLKPHLESTLFKIFSQLPKQDLEKTQIIVSGHSHGGSIAGIATADLAGDFLKDTFSGFHNPLSNRLYGYFIAAPRIGDETFVQWAESVVGGKNVIRHTAQHDVVANLVPGQSAQSLLQKIPFIGELLAKKFAGYHFFGTLALDEKMKTLNRVAKLERLHHDPDETILDLLQQKFYALLGPLHFGSNRENSFEHIFDDKAAHTDLREAIKVGQSHQQRQELVRRYGSLWQNLYFKLFMPSS